MLSIFCYSNPEAMRTESDGQKTDCEPGENNEESGCYRAETDSIFGRGRGARQDERTCIVAGLSKSADVSIPPRSGWFRLFGLSSGSGNPTVPKSGQEYDFRRRIES